MSDLAYHAAGAALVAAAAGAAVYAPLRRPRAGWLGIPFGVATGFCMLLAAFDFSGAEFVELALVVAVAGVGGWQLPWPDSLAALVAGPAIGALFIFFLGGGVDNPVPFIIAACTLGFTLGAAASSVTVFARRRRTRIAAHG